MVRGSFVVIAVAALAALPLRAADSREERSVLRKLFDRAPGVMVADRNGIAVEGTGVEVVLARIGSDGKLVKICVDSEEAARRFLEAPVDQLGKGAREK